MAHEFVSYAFQDLPRKKIKKYAAQYLGVDMAALIMALLDEDSVRHYATVVYLREHAYPVFAKLCEAEKWAAEHEWPRKARGS